MGYYHGDIQSIYMILNIFCLIGNSIFNLNLELLTDSAKKELKVPYFCS